MSGSLRFTVERVVDGDVSGRTPAHTPIFFFSFFNGMIITYANDWTMVPQKLIIDVVLRLSGESNSFSILINSCWDNGLMDPNIKKEEIICQKLLLVW